MGHGGITSGVDVGGEESEFLRVHIYILSDFCAYGHDCIIGIDMGVIVKRGKEKWKPQ